ncbi:MAG: hypothetical protein E7598_01130 [Ruminococcaceae bacterium]|nr:hypothetical protein [Oscillospiraceae bacterium]
MKKIGIFLLVFLLTAILTVSIMAEDVTVFVDGTLTETGNGTLATPYKAISTAVNAIKSTGGTIVLTGKTTVNVFAVPAHSKPITYTSVYDGIDYAETNGACLSLGGRMVLGGESTFENMIIECATSTTSNVGGVIYAYGYKTTFGEGITCTNPKGALIYPSLYAGGYSNNGSRNAVLTVKSGTWRAIFGGNGNGAFTGNSTVNFEGGTVKLSLVGGNNAVGNFTGNTTLNISGGKIESNNGGYGIVGSSLGYSAALTFKGNIAINISGNPVIEAPVLGASRSGAPVTTNGDITIDISGGTFASCNVYGGGYGNVTTGENGILVKLSGDTVTFTGTLGSYSICGGAHSGTVTGDVSVILDADTAYRGSILGGGYSGNVTGHSSVIMYKGTVPVTLTAGSRTGTVGSASVEMYGGKVGYHTSSSYFGITGNGRNDTSGTVTGESTILLDGGDVAGAVELNASQIGSGSVTIKSGKAGSVEDKAVIDLSGGKSLSLGGNVSASSFIGGGTLVLGATGSITADTMSGTVEFEIEGEPAANQTYITVLDKDSDAVVNYTAKDDEALVREVGETVTYTLKYDGRYDTTHVRVYYYNPHGENETQPNIVLYKGTTSSDDRVKLTPEKGNENGKNFIEADLAPGLYYYKVYYGNGSGDYETQYFYITGKDESLTYEKPYEPYKENGYMEQYTAVATYQMLEKLLGTSDLPYYEKLDTPGIAKLDEPTRSYMTNEELCDYIEALDEKCEYLYVFYPFDESPVFGNRTPVMVFTKDEIPNGATLEEVAEIVRGGGVREIMMITGGVHGNEPAGAEGVLNYGVLLAGEYGDNALDSIGAIVLMPASCPDNLQRFKRLHANGHNYARDMLSLYEVEPQNYVSLYDLFKPTVTCDCHEDNNYVNYDTPDNSAADLQDVAFQTIGSPNQPLLDPYGVLTGEKPMSESRAYKMLPTLIEKTAQIGLRSGMYKNSYFSPAFTFSYSSTRGSYAFLIEVMRIWSGKGRYERAVYAMQQGLKTLTDEVIATNGEMAREVYESREAAKVITFDETNIFATKMSRSGKSVIVDELISAYPDGTYKNFGTESHSQYDTVDSYRALPTAYILPADLENIDSVLNLLDLHGIEYEKMANGSKLTLRKYSLGDTVSLGESEEVVLENGAYAVLTDTADVYLIAFLLEPDSYPQPSNPDDYLYSDNNIYDMGYITDSDAYYRSEADYMRDVIAGMGYVEGDVNGDGIFNMADVLAMLKKVVNDEDGSLIDVLRLLKTLAEE